MKELFNKFFNETLKNASKLLIGTLIAQAIPIIFSFVLARIFSESSFGFFGLYISSISILAVVVNLKYESTILLPKIEKEATALVGISSTIAFLFSLVVLVFLVFFSFDLIPFLNWNPENTWVFLIPVSIFSIGVYQSFNYWLIRNKKYTESSINKITQRVVEAPVNLILGKKKVLFGLIYGDVVGRIAIMLQAIYQSYKNGFSFKGIEIADYKQMINRYKSFALINSLPSLANTAANHAPLFIVNHFYGVALAGQLTLVRTVLSIPVSLVSNNISQVVFQQVSERVANNKEFLSILRNIFFLLLALSTFMVVLFLPFGKVIFKLYGAQWDVAGFMSQILVVSFAVKFLVSSFSKILLSLEQIKWISYWQILYLSLVVVLYFITEKYSLGINNFLYAYMSIDIIAYLIYGSLINNAIKNYHTNLPS